MASIAPPAPTGSARPAIAQFPATLVLPAILLAAIALRLAYAYTASFHHPDEIFQYLEAAHRLVFGFGLVPWEYQWGIRSWLFPGLLAMPMALGAALAPHSSLYLWLPKLAMVAVSLALPWSAWALGATHSRRHAIVAALVVAGWAEFAYFAAHPLSENLANALILVAATLLLTRRDLPRAAVAAGLLLGLAIIVRCQSAPVVPILAIAGCGTDRRRWRDLVIGGALATGIGGAIDLVAGTIPFAWLVENVRQNLGEDRATQYGTLGSLGYVTWFEHRWGWLLVVVLPLARIGMKRQPALCWAALVNLVVHSLIAHKEYRFVEFTAIIVILLAAFGTVDAIASLRLRFPRLDERLAFAIAGSLWLAASASVADSAIMRADARNASYTLAATSLLRDDPAACGVATLGDAWGGYAYLHRPIQVSTFIAGDPLLAIVPRARVIERWSLGYNRIVGAPSDAVDMPPAYRSMGCVDAAPVATCVFARPGGCTSTPASPFLAQRVLDRSDAWMRENVRRGLRPVS